MNAILMNGMLKMLKNFVTPEQIKEAAKGLIKSGIDFKNSIQLDPEKGETGAAAIAYEVEGAVIISIIVLNDDMKILRFENVNPLDEVIDNLIKKL
jgi:hypothetical protein